MRRLLGALTCAVVTAGGAGTALVATGAAATSTASFRYGSSGDIPITGDWNGSGKTQIGVARACS